MEQTRVWAFSPVTHGPEGAFRGALYLLCDQDTGQTLCPRTPSMPGRARAEERRGARTGREEERRAQRGERGRDGELVGRGPRRGGERGPVQGIHLLGAPARVQGIHQGREQARDLEREHARDLGRESRPEHLSGAPARVQGFRDPPVRRASSGSGVMTSTRG